MKKDSEVELELLANKQVVRTASQLIKEITLVDEAHELATIARARHTVLVADREVEYIKCYSVGQRVAWWDDFGGVGMNMSRYRRGTISMLHKTTATVRVHPLSGPTITTKRILGSLLRPVENLGDGSERVGLPPHWVHTDG